MSSEAVIYAAKSTVDSKGSIGTQLEDCRAMADQEGVTVIGEFSEEAASAYTGDRGPQLAAAMNIAEARKALIIVQHTDRLARGNGKEARHLVELYFWALKADVRIRSVQDDSTFENLILTAVMGERNTEDSRRKGLAVAAGMRRRFEKGLPLGGKRCYGYKLKLQENGEKHFEIVPAEAIIIERIFTEADQGRSNMKIAKGLEQEHVPTLMGGYWRASTIQKILSNPIYRGHVALHGEERPGIHQPIITNELWDRVRSLRESRQKSKSGGRGRPTSGSHLFTRGFLRCECGDAMAPRTCRNRREPDREIYFCLGRHADVERCAMVPIDRVAVDMAVYSYFENLGLDVQTTRDQMSIEADRRRHEAQTMLDQAGQEAGKVEVRIARVRRDYVNGDISAADWKELRGELEGELDAAAAQVERLKAHLTTIENDRNFHDAESEVVQRLTAIRAAVAGRVSGASDLDAVRSVLLQNFESFELRHQSTRPVPIDLAWVGPDQLVIEPKVKETAIAGFSENGRAMLKRSAINAEKQTTQGQAERSFVFEAFPVFTSAGSTTPAATKGGVA